MHHVSSTSQNVKMSTYRKYHLVSFTFAILYNEIDYNNINLFFFIYINIFLQILLFLTYM